MELHGSRAKTNFSYTPTQITRMQGNPRPRSEPPTNATGRPSKQRCPAPLPYPNQTSWPNVLSPFDLGFFLNLPNLPTFPYVPHPTRAAQTQGERSEEEAEAAAEDKLKDGDSPSTSESKEKEKEKEKENEARGSRNSSVELSSENFALPAPLSFFGTPMYTHQQAEFTQSANNALSFPFGFGIPNGLVFDANYIAAAAAVAANASQAAAGKLRPTLSLSHKPKAKPDEPDEPDDVSKDAKEEMEASKSPCSDPSSCKDATAEGDEEEVVAKGGNREEEEDEEKVAVAGSRPGRPVRRKVPARRKGSSPPPLTFPPFAPAKAKRGVIKPAKVPITKATASRMNSSSMDLLLEAVDQALLEDLEAKD